MAQLGTVLGPFYGWFVGCFMAQLGTILGPFSWLFYGWFVGYFMAQLGTDFRTKIEGNWTSVLHGNCSCI